MFWQELKFDKDLELGAWKGGGFQNMKMIPEVEPGKKPNLT